MREPKIVERKFPAISARGEPPESAAVGFAVRDETAAPVFAGFVMSPKI
jgi:hypothetical protein